MDNLSIDESKELEKNKQLKKDLIREIKSFQNKYSKELLSINKKDIIKSYEIAIKPNKKALLIKKIKDFWNNLINCI